MPIPPRLRTSSNPHNRHKNTTVNDYSFSHAFHSACVCLLVQTVRYDMNRRDYYLAASQRVGHKSEGGGGGIDDCTNFTSCSVAGGQSDTDVSTNSDNGKSSRSNNNEKRDGRPLPFASLRERTFDMTKRGELTSANVWYASRRTSSESGWRDGGKP